MTLWEEKIPPMLAKLSEPFDNPNFIFEVKFDGTRSIIYADAVNKKVRFLNRRMLFFEDRYPELQQIWKNIKAKKAILDSEIVVFSEGRPDFYKLAEREHVGERTRIELLAQLMPATVVVFDILHLNGEDLIDKPWTERRKILEQVVEESDRIILSTYVREKGKEFFQKVKQQGLEGVMAKRIDSSYQVGKRSGDWLKIKFLKTLDCVVCGFTQGTGWREKYFGALILGCFHKGKLRYVGRVGTGWEEEDLKELTLKLQQLQTEKCPFEKEPEFPSDVRVFWIRPKLICEVKFMDLTKDLHLRAPSFIRLREDKKLEECELEVSKNT